MIFILFLLFILLVYVKLYTWRKLPLSLPSFTFFAINFIQLTLYLSTISFFFSIWYYDKSLPPVYLENLSLSSQYRYLFLTIISFFFICGYLLIRIFKLNFQPYISFLTYPYLKEEIRLLIDTWGSLVLRNLFDNIINFFYWSTSFRIIFILSHFIIFYVTRLLTTSLLFYCVFYQGDFRNFLYLTPLILFVWLLSFLNHCFIVFQQGCENYILSLVSATLDFKTAPFFGIIKTDPSQISFKLTEYAISEGFSEIDMYNLTKEWYIQAYISSYFIVYFRFVSYLNYFITLLQISLWFYISKIFFFPLLYFSTLSKFSFRCYATQAHRVLPHYQKKLAQDTEGAHKGSHPALIDPAVKNPDNLSEVLYEGQPTHGKGSAANPSHPLHPSKSLEGNQQPQNFVPPPRVMYTPLHYYNPHQVKLNEENKVKQKEQFQTKIKTIQTECFYKN